MGVKRKERRVEIRRQGVREKSWGPRSSLVSAGVQAEGLKKEASTLLPWYVGRPASQLQLEA